MTKEGIKRELAIARAKGDKVYEQQLLDSYRNTYGEEYSETSSE